MKYGRPEKAVAVQTLPASSVFGQLLGYDSFIKKIWGGWGRAIVGSCAMVTFAVVILLISMLAASNAAGAASNSATAAVAVEYYLAYPGVLPDNPLYKLKVIRDRVVLVLTFDDVKKAEKELLYADKRINAAVILVDGGKVELGVSTATKGEKYLESSIDRTVKLQKNGKDVKSHLLTLEKAARKHLELLREIDQKLSGQEKSVLEKSIVSTEMQLQKVQQTLREES